VTLRLSTILANYGRFSSYHRSGAFPAAFPVSLSSQPELRATPRHRLCLRIVSLNRRTGRHLRPGGFLQSSRESSFLSRNAEKSPPFWNLFGSSTGSAWTLDLRLPGYGKQWQPSEQGSTGTWRQPGITLTDQANPFGCRGARRARAQRMASPKSDRHRPKLRLCRLPAPLHDVHALQFACASGRQCALNSRRSIRKSKSRDEIRDQQLVSDGVGALLRLGLHRDQPAQGRSVWASRSDHLRRDLSSPGPSRPPPSPAIDRLRSPACDSSPLT